MVDLPADRRKAGTKDLKSFGFTREVNLIIENIYVFCPDGGMVDTKDLKSFGLTAVRVQVPLRVPKIPLNQSIKRGFC